MIPRLALMSCMLLAFGAPGARAAELGDAKVSSHIGQQLVADIELVAIDEPSAAVQVRLASADVYRGASLDMQPVLASLNMNVMRRDGRQFLHITSLKPVEADRLHLFLELADGQRRVVRQATLWLTPDPAPRPAASTEPVAVDRWPDPGAAPAPVARKAVASTPEAPAACPRQAMPSPAAACAVLDTKNAMLRDEVVKLENKVRVLQTAMGMGAAAGAVQPAAAKAGQSTPASAPPSKLAVLPVAEQSRGLPWGWIGGLGALVFALVGSFVALRARRRKPAPAAEEPTVEPSEPTLE